MDITTFFYWLFNVLIVLSIIAIIYLILILYMINKNLNRWDKISEKMSISLLEIIPQIINYETVAKGASKIFEIVQKKKEEKAKEKKDK